MKTLLLLIACIGFYFFSAAQDYSNKGREFWIAYPSHVDGTSSVMGIYIASDNAATGNIKVGSSTIPFTVTAGGVTRKFIGNGLDASNTNVYLSSQDGVKTNAAIKITSDVNVVVYAHIIKSARSAATLVLPTPVLGTEYIITGKASANANGNGSEQSAVPLFAAVATQANTTIEVTTTVTGRAGKAAGTTFQVNLPNAGDVYQFHGVSEGDISGTTVKSVATATSACKPIAVFAGSTWTSFCEDGNTNTNNPSGGDNLFQEMFPVRSWGKKFVTAPFKNRPLDIYRIYVKDATTVVSVTENGTQQTLSGLNTPGNYYEFVTGQPIVIEANNPISVAQFITSTTCKQGCTSGSGNNACFADPEMVMLNPAEQTLKDITFFSAHANFLTSVSTNVELHFVNVIVPKIYKASVKIDGAAPKGTFVDIVGTDYAYLQEDLSTSSATNPVHKIKADTTFAAIVYGYGNVESYGYNGGTNVVDLLQYITIKNKYASVNFPATCKDASFNLAITLPYQPVKLTWDFNGNAALSPNTNVVNNSPAFDSSFIKDGKTLYVYKLTGNYVFSQVGNYSIKVIANNPNPDGCSGDQEINYDVVVYPQPIAKFTITASGCSPILFTDSSKTFGRPIIKYAWDFGDGTKDSIAAPSKLYANAGNTYSVYHSIITDIGCLSDTTKTVAVPAPPKAKFGVSTSLCQNDIIQFSDSTSVGSSNTIVKWFWNFGNGKTDTVQNPTTIYNLADTFTVSLYIRTNNGCYSDTAFQKIIIHPLPTADFVVANPLCEKRNILFTDKSKANVGSITSVGWNFGDGKFLNTSFLIGTYKHQYDTTGTYNVRFAVSNSYGCNSDSTAPIAITVNALPQVGYTLPEVCLDDAFAQFYDTSKIADGSQAQFSYLWNFGDKNATVTNPNSSLQPNPKHSYSDTGVYKVTLLVTSKDFCADSLQKSFTVNGSTPKADFVVLNATKLCSNDSVRIRNTSTVDFGNITKLEIFWDTANNPTLKTIDDEPKPNKVYSIVYSAFQQPATKDVYVKMLSYSGLSCVNTKTVKVTLQQSPKVQFNPIVSICNDTTPRIITEASEVGGVPGNPYFYGSGIVNGSTGLYNPKLVAYGVYPIKYLFISNGFGCRDSAIQNITVLQSPTAKFGIGSPMCEKNLINFNDSSKANLGNIVKWDWDFGNGNVISTNNPNAVSTTYGFANNFFATLKVTTDSGCHATTQTIVTVHPLPNVKFGTKNVCMPSGNGKFLDSSFITDAASMPFAYNWNFGDKNDATPSSQQNPTHHYTQADTTQVKLIVTTQFGCIDSLAKQLIIYPQPIANFGIAPKVLLCVDDMISLTDSSNGITSKPIKWSWTTSNGLSSTLPNPSFMLSDSGNIDISLQITNAQTCSSNIAVKTVTIFPYPKVVLPVSLTYLQGGVLTIKPLSVSGNNLSFKWKYNNNDIVADTLLQAQVYPNDDKRFYLRTTNPAGCWDTTSIMIVVLKDPLIPTAFSPNGDGYNDTWVIEHLESYLGCSVQVYDRYGQLVFGPTVGYGKAWDGKHNGKELPVGTYYYIIDPKNGKGRMSGSVTILR